MAFSSFCYLLVLNQLIWFETRSVKNDPGGVSGYAEDIILSNDEV